MSSRPPEQGRARTAEIVPFRTRAPLVGFTMPWRLQPGRDTHTVIVKGALDLATGTLREPEPPMGDVPAGDTLEGSLKYPSDFAVTKPRADVVLHGTAHGGGKRRSSVRLRFAGVIDRTIAVFGPRRYEKGGAPSEPRPFDALPLAWEHAFGGPGQPNPVGCGLGEAVPQIEDPNNMVINHGDTPAPIGLWSVPPLWRERWSLLGTYDDAWLAERYPHFPADMDMRFFQAAPNGQQLAELRGDESFTIDGVRPEGTVRGRLPGLGPRCVAIRGDRLEPVALKLDTVVLDTDAMVAHLVWRGLMPARDRRASDVSEVFLTLEPIGAPLSPRAVEDRYVAERAIDAGFAAPEELPAANDAGDIARDGEAAALGARIRERLGAAGIVAGDLPPDENLPPPEAPVVDASLAAERRALVEDKAARGEALDELELEGADLGRLQLRGRSFVACDLRRANLGGSDLAEADLRFAQLEGADLSGADLTRADLTGADLTAAILDRANLEGASLEGAVLDEAHAEAILAKGARAVALSARNAVLRRATFAGADLTAANFADADLSEATFDGSALKDARLYRASAKKTGFTGAALVDLRGDEVDLAGARLDDADLTGAVLDGASLEGTSLLRAQLADAGLRGVRAKGALLSGASMRRARLAQAELTSAVLDGADLMEATLEGANLQRADLRGTSLYAAELFETDLRGAMIEGADFGGTRLEKR